MLKRNNNRCDLTDATSLDDDTTQVSTQIEGASEQTQVSLGRDGNDDNLSDFNKDRIAEEALKYLRDKGLLSEEAIDQNKGDLADHLGTIFPEFDKIETLRQQFRATVEQPEVSFKDSGLTIVDYLRTYYDRSIRRGILLVSELSDTALKRRISVEKARGGLPDDLAKACLTYHDLLFARRDALHTITGIPREEKQTMSALGRSLIDRHTKRNRHNPSVRLN